MARQNSLDDMFSLAVATGDDWGRSMVPEHGVKQFLREHSVLTPSGFAVNPDDPVEDLAKDLRGPLALKAFGSGLVHKSDVGAVELGVSHDSLSARIAEMGARLNGEGIHPEGYLVEEQIPQGPELLLGIVRRDPFGLLVVFGVGGTMTEVANCTSARLFPLRRPDAQAMVDGLPASIRAGGRTGAPIDCSALVEFMLDMAGDGGIMSALVDKIDEFECNPIIANGPEFHAVDARLILRAPGTLPEQDKDTREQTDFTNLFSPRTVAVAGASSTREAFGNHFLAAYRAAGWETGLYALHPTAGSIDGVPAVRSLAEIPGGADYLLSAVSASATPGLLREVNGSAKFVQVTASGFSEVGNDELSDDLLIAAAESGVRVLGPNCMGVYSPAGRQNFLLNTPEVGGHVSVVSQSGSLASEVILSGASRGLDLGKLVTVGNAVDVSTGELLDWLAEDDETRVVGLYVEGIKDPHFVSALRRLQGRKPVVVLVGGLSEQGAQAVASHTGAMAGEERVWQALADSLGIVVVRRLEHFLAVLSYLDRHLDSLHFPGKPGALVVGPGGGASVLATDAFDSHGMALPALHEDLRTHLKSEGYGAGTSVANPVEIPIGPSAPVDAFRVLLDRVSTRQSFADVVMHVNVQSWYAFRPDAGIDSLLDLIESAGKVAAAGARTSLVLRSLDAARGDHASRLRAACLAVGLPLFRDFDEAALSVAAAQHYSRHRAENLGREEVFEEGAV